MIILIFLGLFMSAMSAEDLSPITKKWSDIDDKVEMRYFERDDYEGLSPNEIWGKGKKISCQVSDDGETVNLDFPNVSSRRFMKINVFTHGFTDTVKSEKAKFVPAYFNPAQGWSFGRADVGVILVDWSPLASALQFQGWDNYAYNLAARSAIDVGNYVGHCLAEMKKNTNTIFKNTRNIYFNLAGHSLGAHLVGKAGRVYNELVGTKVYKIHGLDPAGPRFVDGVVNKAICVLNQNKLNKDSAYYVYIIHTNGGLKPSAAWGDSRLGILDAIGDFDFYLDGGKSQPGCASLDSICSHNRAVLYYYHSLYKTNLLLSYPCSSVTDCRDKKITSGKENLAATWTSIPAWGRLGNLFYTPIEDTNWTYDGYN